MADVITGARLDVAHAQGQTRLGALQCLAPLLFITAQHQRLGRRVQIQPDDISELGFKLRVVGQFEGAGQIGLDVVGLPQGMYGARRNLGGPGHGAHAVPGPPLGRLGGLREDQGARGFRYERLAPPPAGNDYDSDSSGRRPFHSLSRRNQ